MEEEAVEYLDSIGLKDQYLEFKLEISQLLDSLDELDATLFDLELEMDELDDAS